MRPSEHPRQAERLAALRRYDILDTPREEEFDEIVELVSRLCDAPISVINLIDAERQWFKAEVGLGVRETPLETSICGHVILDQDFVEIPDTRRDRRLSGNPLCLAPETPLRFYAGALLKTEEGLPIGTLCVLDHKPRVLNDLQRKAIRVLARQTMRQLDLRLALRRQEVLRREVDHRVTNSLATISAMLRLQARAARDEAVKEAVESALRRVEAVGALHREMHAAEGHGTVDLSRFMTRIGGLLNAAAPGGVAVRIDFEAASVEFEVASALAMIVNEFVANSLKHGFPQGRAGTVALMGRLEPDGSLRVLGSDDGAGAETGPEEESAGAGLGLKIMRASAATIGADLDLAVTEAGARMTLTVPPRPGQRELSQESPR